MVLVEDDIEALLAEVLRARLHADHPPATERLTALVEQWKAEGTRIDTFHATMGTGYHVCAEHLAAALSRLTAKE